jgi:GAF domain-containing protein
MKKAIQRNKESQYAEPLRMQRFYELLARTNHAIIHSKTATELFEQICDAAVGLKICDSAWIGMLQEDGELSPVACAGTAISRLKALKYNVKDEMLQTHSVSINAVT